MLRSAQALRHALRGAKPSPRFILPRLLSFDKFLFSLKIFAYLARYALRRPAAQVERGVALGYLM